MTRLRDLRHKDPEVRKERVKLLANSLNAIGLALLVGSLIAPALDQTRHPETWRIAGGAAVGVAAILSAYYTLRYIKPREP